MCPSLSYKHRKHPHCTPGPAQGPGSLPPSISYYTAGRAGRSGHPTEHGATPPHVGYDVSWSRRVRRTDCRRWEMNPTDIWGRHHHEAFGKSVVQAGCTFQGQTNYFISHVPPGSLAGSLAWDAANSTQNPASIRIPGGRTGPSFACRETCV